MRHSARNPSKLLPFVLTVILYYHNDVAFVNSLALLTPPPKAGTVILGTSDYSNILFGKVQRAASLYGTNLNQQPLSILQPPDSPSSVPIGGAKDSEGSLNKVLWNRFGLAMCGPEGTLEEADCLRPLSWWIPQAEMKEKLVFLDAASETSSTDGNPFTDLLRDIFVKQPKGGSSQAAVKSPPIPLNVPFVQCAVQRNCAHIYILSNDASLPACLQTLSEHAPSTPATILVLERGTTLAVTSGWKSALPQDMEGELSGPVSLRSYSDSTGEDEYVSDEQENGARTFPAEDAAEVMVQVALRTDRSPTPSDPDTQTQAPRVVRMGNVFRETDSPGSAGDGTLEERLNADYFTMMGG